MPEQLGGSHRGSRVKAVLRSRGLELAIGLVMIVVGVILTASAVGQEKPNGVIVFAGGSITALGGVLISWIASAAFTLEAARSQLDAQLDAVSRALGQASGSINHAVEQALRGEASPDTALALISQATTMIYGQVDQLQVMLERQFDSGNLLQTVDELDNLARQLGRSEHEVDAPKPDEANVREDLDAVRARLEGMRAEIIKTGGVRRTESPVQLACPYCAAVETFMLGDFSGATSEVGCNTCRLRFNIHRGSNGFAFSRPDPRDGNRTRDLPAGASKELVLECPQCSEELTFAVPPGSAPERTVFCKHCLSMLGIDIARRKAEDLGPMEMVHGEIVGVHKNSRPKVVCEKCGKLRNAFARVDDAYVAMCWPDHRLISVPIAEWVRYRGYGLDDDGRDVVAKPPPLRVATIEEAADGSPAT